MKALWLEDQKLRLRDDVAHPEPPPGEVLVRVIVAGVCNTDIELTRGYYPFSGIPGHEFVGMVEEGPSTLLGKRVVGEINASCHECAMCRAGYATHCERRTVLGIVNRNGAFAEYLTLPAENLHIVPDALANDVAVFTEPLAAALEIQEQIALGPNDRVLVVGDGKLAQLVVRTLVTKGCQVMAAGRHEKKRKLLESAGARIVDEIVPRTFDVAVECSGNAEGFALARKGVRPRGTIVMKSTYAGELTLNASSLVVDEITLVGSRCGPFGPALKMLEDGRVEVRPLVDATYPLSDAVAAFEHAQRPGILKVLIEVS